MAASFPGKVRTFSPKVDLVDYVLADHVNSLQNEVTAIEQTLGDNGATLASTYTGTFVKTTSWPSLAARIANIETGLVNGTGLNTGTSPYVLVAGGSAIQPLTGTVGLVMKTVSGTANLFESRNSSNALGFNIDYNGVPKFGTANMLYVGSTEYNAILAAITAAATQLNPMLLAGL